MKTNPLRGAQAAGPASPASPLQSVRGTINYCRPIPERLHIDVRDFSRTNMRFTPHELPVRDARGVEDRLSTRDEVVVFKAFDSDAPDALNAAHTAFDDPSAPADAVPRASIEARFVAFFD